MPRAERKALCGPCLYWRSHRSWRKSVELLVPRVLEFRSHSEGDEAVPEPNRVAFPYRLIKTGGVGIEVVCERGQQFCFHIAEGGSSTDEISQVSRRVARCRNDHVTSRRLKMLWHRLIRRCPPLLRARSSLTRPASAVVGPHRMLCRDLKRAARQTGITRHHQHRAHRPVAAPPPPGGDTWVLAGTRETSTAANPA